MRIIKKFERLDDKKTPFLYKIIRYLVWFFSPRYELSGMENIPETACVFVGNHSQMYGPIAGELYTPGRHATWCAGEMMDKKEVPAYAYKDFWSGKPSHTLWFYRILSYMIAPLSELIFNSAHTIGVYHDMRIMDTFRQSLKGLSDGVSIVIFPEHYDEYNNIVHEFQDKFISLGKLYARKTGTGLKFVPMYISPRLKKICFGKAVEYDPSAKPDEEMRRISLRLMNEITVIAADLPKHTVVPYPNIPKNEYPESLPLVYGGKYSGMGNKDASNAQTED